MLSQARRQCLDNRLCCCMARPYTCFLGCSLARDAVSRCKEFFWCCWDAWWVLQLLHRCNKVELLGPSPALSTRSLLCCRMCSALVASCILISSLNFLPQRAIIIRCSWSDCAVGQGFFWLCWNVCCLLCPHSSDRVEPSGKSTSMNSTPVQ